MDIKQLIPSPSPAAIYNIFRSCLNELVRTRIVDTSAKTEPVASPGTRSHSLSSSPSVPAKRRASSQAHRSDPPLLHAREVTSPLPGETASSLPMSSSSRKKNSSSARAKSPQHKPSTDKTSSSSLECEQLTVPSYLALKVESLDRPELVGGRVWALAEKCVGFSGRTLRRLPILGLAMYTWGGSCSLHDAITALESAVEQELKAKSE